MATSTSTGTVDPGTTSSSGTVTSPGTVSSGGTTASNTGTVSSGGTMSSTGSVVRQRDEADKQIAENLAKPAEPPVPSQEEADQMKERALSGGVQRDMAAGESGPGYTTR